MKPVSMVPGVATRVSAAQVLDGVLHQGRSLKAELAQVLPTIEDPRDRALLEAICFTALRQRARYDAALQLWLQKPLADRDAGLRALLLAGFAQLDGMGLPAHAAVSATVEAARALDRGHQAGLVNALLRRAQREGSPEGFPEGDPAATWPAWLRKKVGLEWGAGAAEIFAASAQAAPLWLRVNRRLTTPADYQAELAQAGIEASTDSVLADALRLDAPVAVGALPGFGSGRVSVQDAAAQAVADAFAPAPGARVLDACAAPGGKAAHLLERDPTLQLLALDVDARRLARIGQTLERVGVQARLLAADATDPAAWWDGVAFHAVLLDAPCSATGVVRRQPDVLLHRRPEDLAAVCALQARLLDATWRTLAPGGVLLYATCSILKDENQHQVEAFLARTPGAAAEPLDARFGRAVPSDGQPVGYQRLPGEHGGDGFFYARLRKA